MILIFLQIITIPLYVLVEAKVKNDHIRNTIGSWLNFIFFALYFIIPWFIKATPDKKHIYDTLMIIFISVFLHIKYFILYKKNRIEEKEIKEKLAFSNVFFVSLMVMALYFEEKIQITSYPFIILNAAVLGITAAVCFKFKKQAVLNGARLIGILLFIISASLPFFKSDTIFICLLYSFLFYATDYAAYMGGYPIPTEKIIFRAFVNDIVVSVLFCTVYFTM